MIAAQQARITVLLVRLSGLYMLYPYDLWDRVADARYWWMHSVVAVWLLFAALLFVLEPLAVHRVIDRGASIAAATAWGAWCIVVSMTLLAAAGWSASNIGDAVTART